MLTRKPLCHFTSYIFYLLLLAIFAIHPHIQHCLSGYLYSDIFRIIYLIISSLSAFYREIMSSVPTLLYQDIANLCRYYVFEGNTSCNNIVQDTILSVKFSEVYILFVPQMVLVTFQTINVLTSRY